MSGYHYECHEVPGGPYDQVDLGGEFMRGIVVDGLIDGDRNVLLIVTRHEEEADDG